MTPRPAADLLVRRGRTRLRPAIAVVALCSVIVLAACHAGAGSRDAAETVSAADSNSHTGSPVRLDASQLQQVRTEELSTHAPEDSIEATGAVEFNADRMARVLPPVSGQVRDLAVNVGDTVIKDSVLFVLSSREVASAISDHRASHKDLELAEKTFAMTDDLFAHQAASRMALQQAENDVAKAKARVLQADVAPAGSLAHQRNGHRAQRHERAVRRTGQPAARDHRRPDERVGSGGRLRTRPAPYHGWTKSKRDDGSLS